MFLNNRWTGLVGCILAGVWTLCAYGQAAAVAPSVTELTARAQQYLRDQKPDQALPVLQQIVSLDPANLNARANLGVLQFFQGHYSEAIPQLREALKLQAGLWKIQALLGIAEKRTGDLGDAQMHLEAALPQLTEEKIAADAGLELIETDTALGMTDKAAAAALALERRMPEDPQILAAVYRTSSQVMDQMLLSMAVIAPDSGEMHRMVAAELVRQRNRQAAIRQYREAIRIAPGLPGVHYELAELLRTSGEASMRVEAAGEYKAALAANPYDGKAWYGLGELTVAGGDFQGAEQDFTRALALNPNDSDAETAMAEVLMDNQEFTRALPLLEHAVKADPTNMVAHYRLSLLLRNQGKTAEARQEMDKYLHLKKVSDELENVLQRVGSDDHEKGDGDAAHK